MSFLSHIVKIFGGGGGKGGARLSGMDFGLVQSSNSRGNPRSSDHLMVVLSVISSIEASARSFFVVINSCLLVRRGEGNPRSRSPRSDNRVDAGWRYPEAEYVGLN
jgi:hypothetical protein